MIGFLKKFVNSTIGTRNSKALDLMLTDKTNVLSSKLADLDRKINKSYRWYHIIKTGVNPNGKQYIGSISGEHRQLRFITISGTYNNQNNDNKFLTLQCEMESTGIWAIFPTGLNDVDHLSKCQIAVTYAIEE